MTAPDLVISEFDEAMTKISGVLAMIFDIQSSGYLTKPQTDSCQKAETGLQRVWTQLADAKSALQP